MRRMRGRFPILTQKPNVTFFLALFFPLNSLILSIQGNRKKDRVRLIIIEVIFFEHFSPFFPLKPEFSHFFPLQKHRDSRPPKKMWHKTSFYILSSAHRPAPISEGTKPHTTQVPRDFPFFRNEWRRSWFRSWLSLHLGYFFSAVYLSLRILHLSLDKAVKIKSKSG